MGKKNRNITLLSESPYVAGSAVERLAVARNTHDVVKAFSLFVLCLISTG